MIKLARIFQDGMTLQRDKPIKVWGVTDTSQTLSISIDNVIVLDNIKIDDHFSFLIPPTPSKINCSIEFKGVDLLILSNVDIGEVWLAGGQSNMEFQLKYTKEFNTKELDYKDTHLRYYDVGKYSFNEEEQEGFKDSAGFNKWLSYNKDNSQYYSAAAYYFAKELRDNLNLPVAIIGCNYGGTSIVTWIKEDYFINNEILKPLLDNNLDIINKIDLKKYNESGVKARQLIASPNVIKLTDNMMKGTSVFKDTMKGLVPSMKVIPYTIKMGPANPNRVSGLYHSMLENIIGYSIKGVIWYQGESDSAYADIYDILFSSLILNWRKEWNDELPFVFVQLAPFLKSPLGNGLKFPIIREKQELISNTIKDTYMISIMDIGMKKDIHPKNKKLVGLRLGKKALSAIYSKNDSYSNPEYDNYEIKDDSLIISFKNAKKLINKGDDLSYVVVKINNKSIKKLKVELIDNTIIINHPLISINSKIEIWFAYLPYCQVSIYNELELPVQPFHFSTN
jgi:sialate O-acetylesterase